MKKILFIVSLFLFTSCLSSGGYVSFDRCEFYEIDTPDSDVVYYFSYPQGGSIEESGDFFVMNYKNCSVEFGYGLNFQSDPSDLVDIKTYEKNKVSYQAWYKDAKLFRYGGLLPEYDYGFWLFDGQNGVSACVNVLETMAESFTNTPFYKNDDYGFKIDLLPDYKMEYLPSGEGVVMRKRIEGDACDDASGEEDNCGYKVEIYVSATDNVMKYKNLAEFLADKYPGYSAEFTQSGVFVDEGAGKDAVRHYFMIEDGGSYIYEAYLKVPSIYYTAHKGEFDGLVETFKLF